MAGDKTKNKPEWVLGAGTSSGHSKKLVIDLARMDQNESSSVIGFLHKFESVFTFGIYLTC